MHAQSALNILAVTAISLQTVSAQFFNIGQRSLLRTRIDPIVSPGKVAGHVHVYSGSSAFSHDMTHESAVNAECTSSQLGADKSGYWAPQLYYKWKNGTYTAIDGDGLVVYWLYRGFKDGLKPAVLPDDFRMVAGNMSREYIDMKEPSHQAVSFPCYGKGYGHQLPYIPADIECETIRPQILFPNCWNGVDSYKADNSHVAHSLGNPEHGKCPEGFVRIPTLFIETYYHPKSSIGPEYEWYPGCLVFANGDNFGLTFHADWLNGFPSGMLSKVFDECQSMSGNFRDCPLLAQHEVKDGNCLSQNDPNARIINEPIGLSVPLAKLPGNNPEFNSSRFSNSPRQPISGYVESAQPIRATTEQGGVCVGNTCNDYHGPTGGGSGSSGGSGDEASGTESVLPATTSAASGVPDAMTTGRGVGIENGSGATVVDPILPVEDTTEVVSSTESSTRRRHRTWTRTRTAAAASQPTGVDTE